jgi:hypothetical protein
MSDDFGTISVGRAERAKEIEEMRQRYRRQREALVGLVADAPTEALAGEYQRLVRDIDVALVKIDEMENPRVSTAGMRPLVTTKLPDTDLVEPRSRLPLIIVAAFVGLGLIGALLWYASSDRKPDDGVVVEDTAVTTETTATGSSDTTGTVVPIEGSLSVSPPAHDYGVVRKGTRATRQYEVTNRSDEPVTISLARSACRCLYYEYQALIPPKGRESVTVTIDGARAKAGEIRESVKVTPKSDPSGGTSFDVIATVQ